MNPDNMGRMSAKELDEYGRALGIEMRPARSIKDKLALIEGRREREAVIEALGLELRVAKKRLADKRLTDLLGKPDRTDAETLRMMELLLGEEQLAQVIEACTDEDGTIDNVAMAVALARVLGSRELKN